MQGLGFTDEAVCAGPLRSGRSTLHTHTHTHTHTVTHTHTHTLVEASGEVPRGEKMLFLETDLESYVTEYTLIYDDKIWGRGGLPAGASGVRLSTLVQR